ncbi:MAG: hypothetical protein PHQ50_05910 [Eubacteriales bacterium]|nr:hypothetical protein [Eubacteriales bacterium]
MKKSTKGILLVLILLTALTSIAVILNYREAKEKLQYLEAAEIQIINKGTEEKALTMQELEGLEPTEFKAKMKSSLMQSAEEHVYLGFPLAEVLSLVELAPGEEEILSVGSVDGYEVPFSKEELENIENIFLVYKADGNYLGTYGEKNAQGPYMIVIREDRFSQRWAKYVCRLELIEK